MNFLISAKLLRKKKKECCLAFLLETLKSLVAAAVVEASDGFCTFKWLVRTWNEYKGPILIYYGTKDTVGSMYDNSGFEPKPLSMYK